MSHSRHGNVGQARTDRTLLVIAGERVLRRCRCCAVLQRYDDAFGSGEHVQIDGESLADNLVDLDIGPLRRVMEQREAARAGCPREPERILHRRVPEIRDTGKLGGDVPRASVSTGSPSGAGSSTSTSAPVAPPALKNGRPWTWSQCK